ncbi:ATP-dependent protease [Nitriliruptoraceae bacterium ZYF776]|nr:ATP-dependent protease [Profundirhabdus halotolerans]
MPRLPMFPLGTVLFPHKVLPLHVFEPRYRALVQDVLADGQEFGVVLITRGHEVGGGESRSDVGTVARVLQSEELDDGRYLLISIGTRRIRVTEWLPDDPYPCAMVEDWPDDPPSTADTLVLRDRIAPRLRRVLAMHAELGNDGVPSTIDLADDPDVACWQAAVAAPLTPFDAQDVLTTPGCEDRFTRLDELLADLEVVLRFQLEADAAAEHDDERD